MNPEDAKFYREYARFHSNPVGHDSWKLASPEEGVELEERWDDVTSVEECVHGEHPLECSLCTSAGLHAAVSGEGEDDMGDLNDVSESTIKRMDEWIAGASVKELRAATYAIDREIARRKAENDQERKELEQFEKPVRKTRSDAGTTRRKVEAA